MTKYATIQTFGLSKKLILLFSNDALNWLKLLKVTVKTFVFLQKNVSEGSSDTGRKAGEMAAEYSALPSKENLHLNYIQTETNILNCYKYFTVLQCFWIFTSNLKRTKNIYIFL